MTTHVFALPDLGEGLTDAELVRWLVSPGDEVTVDQPIAEVETAKAAVELPCPYAGTVAELHANPGDTIEVGTPVITVTAPTTAESPPASPAPGPEPTPSPTPGPAPSPASGPEAKPSPTQSPGSGHEPTPGPMPSPTSSHAPTPAPGLEAAPGPTLGPEPTPGSAATPRPEPAPGSTVPSAVPDTAPGAADGVPAQAGRRPREPGTEPGNVLVGFGPRDRVRRSRAERRRRLAAAATPGAAATRPAGPDATTPGPADAGRAGSSAADARPDATAAESAGSSAADAGRAGSSSMASGAADAGPGVRAVSGGGGAAGGGAVAVVSPLVRRLARERGVDVRGLRGSGPDGLVLRRDVESAIAGEGVRRIPLRGVRGQMAERMARSRREIPEATVWVDVDATEFLAVRDAINAADTDHPVGLLALLARFCVLGLARYPELNARVDTEAREVVLQPGVNLGFAAQTDRGLVVPVVRDAHTRTARNLSAELTALTRRARSGELTPSDLTGGTFTVNNYGVFGVDGSAAIINHPETAIIGLGRIIDRPWAVDGTLQLRKVTELTLAFDHRACDGGTAGGFLRYVADCVERPSTLIADV